MQEKNLETMKMTPRNGRNLLRTSLILFVLILLPFSLGCQLLNNLTDDPADDSSPAWSPDGILIAFTSERDGNREICVMNVDGSFVLNLTNNPANDYDPIWSKDGSRIAFVSGRDGNSEIYIINADGNGLMKLTDDPAIDYLPVWSP
jgi:Tol biopolymer transport system component